MRVATIETIIADAEPWEEHDADSPARARVVTSAELAECTCPEACDRDHERD